MVRKYNTQIHCPHCNNTITEETAFERWMRGHPQLDSVKDGIVRFDLDVLLHKYKNLTDVRGDRSVQVMFFIEVKTHGAEPDTAQRDTLHILNQVLRNNRTNNKGQRKGWHLDDHDPISVAYSLANNKKVTLKMRGGHLLQLSGDSPETSKWIRWDRKLITLDQLVQILRCELDPDTLKKWDHRRRQVAEKEFAKKLF